MAKKYKHFQRTDQSTRQTNYRKTLMSSKKTKNWAIHANFSQCSYEVDKTRHIPTKNSKNNVVVVKSVLDCNCKRFRDTAMRENFNLKIETYMKKTHSNIQGNYTHEYNEVKDKL